MKKFLSGVIRIEDAAPVVVSGVLFAVVELILGVPALLVHSLLVPQSKRTIKMYRWPETTRVAAWYVPFMEHAGWKVVSDIYSYLRR
jgi:hypothetical protein